MTVHKNNIQASNLFLFSIVLGLINFGILYFSGIKFSNFDLKVMLAIFIFIGLIAFISRKGIKWIRIPIMVFFILVLVISISIAKKIIHIHPIVGIMYLLQAVVQIFAALLLYKTEDVKK